MTRTLGSELPDLLRQLLDGAAVAACSEEDLNPAFLLVTADEAGWPHLAMLSLGELVAVDPHTLRAGLWLNSTTTRNLGRDGRALLAVVAEGNGYYVRLTASRGADLDLGPDGRLAYFVLHIDEVLLDAAEYATLTSGVTFRLHQPKDVLPRWQHAIAALRAA
ncbi:MAG TPA: pyridoxamine 5'-phosphate oxidase family protein [Chloroflexota bacterium]|jgi:hypothetical protein|nr:pyridoxamine 5'-phosphate oxidase family protein [Chloroflexota bacterium]